MLNNYLQVQIKEHALENIQKECCGFIVGNEIYKCDNISKNVDHFQISSSDYLKSSKLGEISAVYHSHCNGNNDFSEFDKQMADNLNIKYVLYCNLTNEFKEYIPQSNKNVYVGREFKIGKSDCFSLFREFYKNELMIDMEDIIRSYDWYNGDKDLFQDVFDRDNHNWIITYGQPQIEELKKNDAIVFRFKKAARDHHIAVYLGNGTMLHQLENRYSTIENYSKPYQRKTSYTARHKNLI